MTEKLHKVLADRGLGSRREMERWIAAGRVAVNGQVAGIGMRVDPTDDLMVDGQRLGKAAVARTRVLIANKRAGVIVSRRDPQGRPSVFDDLPRLRSGRWISVGRLDLQTTGLLLFTNDGELANKLAHPSTGIDREYAVRVFGRLEDAALERLKAGVVVNDRVEAFSDIRYYDGSGANHWYHVVLMEGRNREVRELFATEGVTVSRLKRVRYGPVILPPWLPRGTWEEVGPRDIAQLQTLLGLPARRVHETRVRAESGRKPRSVLIPYPKLAATASKTPRRTGGR